MEVINPGNPPGVEWVQPGDRFSYYDPVTVDDLLLYPISETELHARILSTGSFVDGYLAMPEICPEDPDPCASEHLWSFGGLLLNERYAVQASDGTVVADCGSGQHIVEVSEDGFLFTVNLDGDARLSQPALHQSTTTSV